jgi:hypothetical protein
VPNTSDHPPTGSPIEIEDCKAGQTGGMLVAESNGNFEIVFAEQFDRLAGNAAEFVDRFIVREG